MKLRLLLTGIYALLFIVPSFSQERAKDSIDYFSSFFGVSKYYMANEKLDASQVREYMKVNPQALKLFNKSRTLNTFSTIVGVVGGFMVGYELGSSLGKGRAVNWGVMGPGLALTGASIIFDIGSKGAGKKSVHLYNERFR